MGKSNQQPQSLAITTTEELSLPINEQPSMGIRRRDWDRLKKSVQSISSEAKIWETIFTITSSVFISFLISALGTDGPTSWPLGTLYWAVTVFSLGLAGLSLFGWRSEKKRVETNKEDVLGIIVEIEGLYPSPEEPLPIETNNISSIRVAQAPIPTGDDELFEEALALARSKGKVSTSMLQRYLRIGYGRAARMIDRMEVMGIIGERTDSSRPRDVL